MNFQSNLQNSAIRIAGNLLSPRGNRSKLLILTYHRVLADPDILTGENVDEKTFDWQVATLHKQFNILRLTDAIDLLKNGNLPERAVCITFDDGYADNYERALPILKKWQVPATFFVAIGFLDGGRMWNDTVIESIRRAKCDELDLNNIGLGIHSLSSTIERKKAIYSILRNIKYMPLEERNNTVNKLADIVGEELPDDMMMTTNQVHALGNQGMEIGAHTVNHPILASLSPDSAESEIVGSKQSLEEITGYEINAFAYPNGKPGVDYIRENVDAVRRAGFRVSVSTAWGYASNHSDVLQLPRVGSWDNSPFRFGIRMLSVYMSEREMIV